MPKEKGFFGTSIITNMLTGGTKETASPPESESALSQGLQTMIDMTVEGTKKLVTKALKKQGISPWTVLKNLIFNQEK